MVMTARTIASNAGSEINDPAESQASISLTYCRFAGEHTRPWTALFEQDLKPGAAGCNSRAFNLTGAI